jgi:hypothetical protein
LLWFWFVEMRKSQCNPSKLIRFAQLLSIHPTLNGGLSMVIDI